jgi:hypothetical protein
MGKTPECCYLGSTVAQLLTLSVVEGEAISPLSFRAKPRNLLKFGSDCLENQAKFGFQNSFFATIVFRIVKSFLIAAITAVIFALPTESNL